MRSVGGLGDVVDEWRCDECGVPVVAVLWWVSVQVGISSLALAEIALC